MIFINSKEDEARQQVKKGMRAFYTSSRPWQSDAKEQLTRVHGKYSGTILDFKQP